MARALRVACVQLVLILVMSALVYAAPGQNERDERIDGGYQAMRKGRYDVATEQFRQAVEALPDSVDARLGLSWALMKQHQYLRAVEQAVKVLDTDAKNARANALVGAILMRVGALPEAAASFQVAIEANPHEPLALAGLGELDLYQGRLAEGIKKVRSAVAQSPKDEDFLYLLALSAARQEFFEEASQAYERFLRVAPDLDSDRKARIRGLIQLYHRLSGIKLYLRGGDENVDVPLRVSESRLPAVDVMINGKGPYQFVIDSGAGFVVISDHLAKELKIKPLASGGTSRGVSGSGRFPIVYGMVDKLAMSGMSMDNVPAYIRKIHDADRSGIEGYIGLSVLSHYRVTVDYEKRVLELRSSEDAPPPIGPDDLAIPYRMTNGGMLSVRADIGKEVPLNFILDTGASSTVVSTNAFTRFNLAEKQHKGVFVRVVGAGGVTDNVPVVVLDQLFIQGAAKKQEFVRAIVLDLNPLNETSGFEQSGIIGSDFLRFYRVEIDFAHGLIVLRPNGSRGALTAGPAAAEGDS